MKQEGVVGIVGNWRAHRREASGYHSTTGLHCESGRRPALPGLPIVPEKMETQFLCDITWQLMFKK